ncbi:hypothetical protein OkiPb00461_07600 [Escherichia coli]
MTKVSVRQKHRRQRAGQKNQPNDAYEYASIVCFAGKVLNSDMTLFGNDSNLLIVFYVQIMPDDFVMQLHRF